MKSQGNVEDYDQSIIKTLRENKKWSRRELAEISGITQQTILNVEQNRFPASLSTITSLIQALGIDFSRYVNISHRYKSAILKDHPLEYTFHPNHDLKFYEYNGYLLGNCILADPVINLQLTQQPYFNVFTYVISGSIELNIDGETYTINPNECISYSGLTSRTLTTTANCQFIIIYRNKCKIQHTPNPLEELPILLQSYEKRFKNEKDVKICKEEMDFSFIKYLRNIKNMSLDTLAEASGLSTSAISLIENNKRAPSLATISAISSVLEENTVNFFTLAQKIPTTLIKSEQRSDNYMHAKTDDGIKFNYVEYNEADGEIKSEENHLFCLEIHVPISGEMLVEVEDGSFNIKPGTTLAFDGMRQHSYKPKGQYTGLYIELPKANIIAE